MDWYPRFPLAYAADTMHLTLAEHGAYCLLIDWYMVHKKAIPDDNAAIAKILGCEVDEWIRVSAALRPFFTIENGRLKHKRCERELNEQNSIRLQWVTRQRKSRALKKLKSQQTVTSDSHEMSRDRTGQDKTVKNI